MQKFVKAGPTPRTRSPRTILAASAALLLAAVALVVVSPGGVHAAADPTDHFGGLDPSTWQMESPDPASLDQLLAKPPAPAADRLAGAVPVPQAATQITYRITSGNAIGLTVLNNAFFGNNFRSRSPSMEYPLGSNIDHLPRGGIWIGAVTADGDTLVSTSVVDAVVSSLIPTVEFMPVSGTTITEMSMLEESRYYNPRALSEQDFAYSCADTSRDITSSSADPHVPLHIRVDAATHLFGFEPFEAIVIATFKIINIGIDPLRDVRVGMYTELASGYKDPSNANWTSGWFKKKALEYVADSTRLVMEHNYQSEQTGQKATSWAGIKLLGMKPAPADSVTVSFNWWNWNPALPWTDRGRYRILGNGETDITSGIMPGTDDPAEVLSIAGGGPGHPSALDILESGDTLEVSFAFVGGQNDVRVSGRNARQDLLYNAHWAQVAYDANFRIPTPPPSPVLTITPGQGTVTLEWSGLGPELTRDRKTGERDFEGYRVHISEERSESGFARILERDVRDGIGYDTGLADIRDRLLEPSRPETIWTDDTHTVIDTIGVRPEVWHYKYTINGLRDGFQYWVSVTAFDRGTLDVGSLESGLARNMKMVSPGAPASVNGRPKVTVIPNPYRGDAAWDGSLRRDRYLWFANLPPRCTIRIYTLAGDLVDTINFDQATYAPIDIRGIFDPTDPRNPESSLPQLSGGMAAWDLVSRKDQGVASGLYLFSVESPDGGDRQVGKFLIIK
jgi:hypothetical protein